MTDPRTRAVDQALLDGVAARHHLRRLFVVGTARAVPVVGLVALVTTGAILAGPGFGTGALKVLAGACVLALGATFSYTFNQNPQVVREWRWLRLVAPLLQAAFYTAYIAGAVFVFVVHAPIVLSSIVTLNLFGLLFWQFRRRLDDDDSETSGTPLEHRGRGV